jgi:hypothetical protein
MPNKNDIEVLLELDGIIIEQNNGFWTKFEVMLLDMPSKERPHGIRYSLTLHDRYGTRVLGFDNAHAIKPNKKAKYCGHKTYDHQHRHSRDRGIPYFFNNAYELLKDFWLEVDKALKDLKGR